MTTTGWGLTLVAIAALAPLPSAARGDTDPDCSEGGRTQREINFCADRARLAPEKRLDALLDALAAKLTPAERKALEAVQRQWEAYRDAHCAWMAGFVEGGSILPTVRAYCLQSGIEDRIEELKIVLCDGPGLHGECEASHRFDRPGVRGEAPARRKP